LSFSTKTKTTAATTATAGTRNISPIFDRKIDETTAGQACKGLIKLKNYFLFALSNVFLLDTEFHKLLIN
jgi:hypothetical protein